MTTEEKMRQRLHKQRVPNENAVFYLIKGLVEEGLLSYAEEKEPEFSLDWPHGWIDEETGSAAVLLSKDHIVEGVSHLVWCVKRSESGYPSDFTILTYQDGRKYRKGSLAIINKPAPKKEIQGSVFSYPDGTFLFCPALRSNFNTPSTLTLYGVSDND